MTYLDTSVLVALMTNEPSAPAIKRWLVGQGDSPLSSSDWCVTEVASALAIKVRTGQLRSAQADESWEAFGAACDGMLTLVPVQPGDFSVAAQMCRIPASGLRAGDALHLAVALRCECKSLLTFDQNLNKNAMAAGLVPITV